MKYAIMGICIAAIVAICIILLIRKLKNKREVVSFPTNTALATRNAGRTDLVDGKACELKIQMEMLPIESIPDKGKLVEITDSKVLAHINNLVPELAQVCNVTNNAVQAARAGEEVLYRVIIPAGVKLDNSRAMKGAVRGSYHGPKGFQGNANWVAVEAQKGTEIVANTAAAAMSVASMVVGQYYMTQINVELGEINDGISRIANFQDNEYRSKVFSLIVQVKSIADFQVEILENDELRLTKMAQLGNLGEECTKLLGLANLTLEGYAKEKDLNYAAYEKKLTEVQNWYMYQKSLLDVLCKISELTYTLNLGKVSREQCNALLPTYIKQSEDAQELLIAWHRDTITRLNINVKEMKRKKDGVNGFFWSIPGKFNDNFNFQSIDEHTADIIAAQVTRYEAGQYQDMTDLYAEDVQLIVKDSKVYYLPECKTEQSDENKLPDNQMV